MSVVLRADKGEELTHEEVDGNFSGLDKRFYVATAAPTTTDNVEAGFSNGVVWFNATTSTMYKCIDAINGTWEEIAFGEASQLEKLTEGTHTGWRLLGADAANLGDIGQNAVDLSYQDSSSGANCGATGERSFAQGSRTTAAGAYSHAEGSSCVATGQGAHAEGFGTVASSLYAHAEGFRTIASGANSHAESRQTTAAGAYSHAEGESTTAQNTGSHAAGRFNIGTSPDTILEVGIGSSGDTKNGFEIYTNGRIHAPELTIALIVDGKSLTTKEYVDAATAISAGDTASRPVGATAGQYYFDTTITKPIWFNGTDWTDAAGTTV